MSAAPQTEERLLREQQVALVLLQAGPQPLRMGSSRVELLQWEIVMPVVLATPLSAHLQQVCERHFSSALNVDSFNKNSL